MKVRWFAAVGMMALLMASGSACGQREAKVEPPKGRVVYQPMFYWQGAKPTWQGTGFFARTEKGEVVGVSSAHFLDFDGPPLLGAVWTDVGSYDAVCVFNTSLGKPGKGRGGDERNVDLRNDYLIMPALGISAEMALPLDGRKSVEKGERVWLPNKDEDAKLGFTLAAGTVTAVETGYVTVELDERIELQSQSGSPFISQKTGAVIGTFSSASESKKSQEIYLTPASAIAAAIAGAKEMPALRAVVGKSPKANQ